MVLVGAEGNTNMVTHKCGSANSGLPVSILSVSFGISISNSIGICDWFSVTDNCWCS